MPSFQNTFLNFGPSFNTHGSFTMLSFLIVSILTFNYGINNVHIFFGDFF